MKNRREVGYLGVGCACALILAHGTPGTLLWGFLEI
jgi:hypothetical protein